MITLGQITGGDMRALYFLAILGFCLSTFPSIADAGHCKKAKVKDPIGCLNSEVAYLTALQKRTEGELGELKGKLPSLISAAMPVGTVLAWKSDSVAPPPGWEFLDIEGRWMVGTNNPGNVGKMINDEPLNLPFETEATASDKKYSWGKTKDNTPHATGTDHKHMGSVSISDRVAFGPPSMQVRYIIKLK